MATFEEMRTVQVGFPEADQLLGDSRAIAEKTRAQAEALAALSTAALGTIESPFKDHYLHYRWPLTSSPILEERLMVKAQANLVGEEEPSVDGDIESSVGLDQFSIYETDFWLPQLADVYGDKYPSSGYPPTGIAQDLIKWTAELANSDWSVLAKLDIAALHKRVDISVYPETETTKELLDEQTRAEEEYTASQWLSERVLMHAYNDEFKRFDWIGSDS